MPTNVLINEHRIIEQVLNCLERMVERCQRQRKLDAGSAKDAIIFFRAFAEGCHREKEQAHLVPAIQAAGVSPERCLGCPMFDRHAESRAHLDAMEAAIESASAGEAPAVEQFTEHAQAYIELLLEYIASEEDCLFPVINQTLCEADKSQLTARLQNSSEGRRVDCECKTYIEIANRLADDLSVPRAVIVDVPRNPR